MTFLPYQMIGISSKMFKPLERNHIKYIHEKQQRKDYRVKSKPELPLDIQFAPFAGQRALTDKPISSNMPTVATIFAGEKIPIVEN